MNLRSTENRQFTNTVKLETEYGTLFFHVETDRPCKVMGISLALPQKLEKTKLYKFIKQLVWEGQ